MTFDLRAARDLREEASFHVALGTAAPSFLRLTEVVEAAYDPVGPPVTVEEITSAITAAAMDNDEMYRAAFDFLTDDRETS
ncbi:hypothetical protein ACGFI3_42790 [Nonomuraea wenchangensis]|uniref:hypothetical protein n=1 Tax=Nonomuraea wenchangensis TaxID=568860 RepID=UPI003717F180